jgi:hypothetical protein
MKFLRLKIFNRNLSKTPTCLLILALASSGCSYFAKKPTVQVDTYCAKHSSLKISEATKKDILSVSAETFEYIKINETTYACDCPAPKPEKERQQCYADFLKIENQ